MHGPSDALVRPPVPLLGLPLCRCRWGLVPLTLSWCGRVRRRSPGAHTMFAASTTTASAPTARALWQLCCRSARPFRRCSTCTRAAAGTAALPMPMGTRGADPALVARGVRRRSTGAHTIFAAFGATVSATTASAPWRRHCRNVRPFKNSSTRAHPVTLSLQLGIRSAGVAQNMLLQIDSRTYLFAHNSFKFSASTATASATTARAHWWRLCPNAPHSRHSRTSACAVWFIVP